MSQWSLGISITVTILACVLFLGVVGHSRLTNTEELELTLQVLAMSATAIAFCVAIRQYALSREQRRAEWLDDLSRRFFEDQTYRNMRTLLDYRSAPEFGRLKSAIMTGDFEGCVEMGAELDQYLNFFERLGALKRLGQLRVGDIRTMFEYYLRLLNREPWLVEYVASNGFEELQTLLLELKETPR